MSDKTYDPIPETVAEALAKWDAGESVFSVSMGGIGPGYEQAIQILAFELMRAWNGKMPPNGVEISAEDKGSLLAIADAVVWRVDQSLGFSGAQVEAAKNLAACVCRRGYRAALQDDAVSDRLIQVSRKMPEWENAQ